MTHKNAVLRSLPLCLALLTTGGICAHAGETRYKDAQGGYSFAVPAGYKRVTAGVPAVAVVFAGKSSGGFAPNVNIVSEPVGAATLNQYIAANKQTISQRMPSAKLFSEKATTLGGIPARSSHMRFSMAGRPPIENLQYYCVRSGRGYVVTFTATPATIGKYAATAEKVRASFKWEK